MLLRSLVQNFLAPTLLAGILLQNANAHTVIQPSEIPEGTRSDNYLVITHGCTNEPVIGTSVVFPDGLDSTIVANGNPHAGPLSDFIQNWGGLIQIYQDHSIFSEQDVKRDTRGNVVGFWAGGGRTIASHIFGRIPFVTSAALINPESCAKSVRFAVAAADICKITTINDLNTTENAVSFWIPAVGSKYDGTPGGHAFDFPVYFTITRDLATNPLPESCGAGLQVTVRPSAAQIDRDMPIQFNGAQVWPQP